MHRTRNAAYSQGYRGFKSLPLRHSSRVCALRSVGCSDGLMLGVACLALCHGRCCCPHPRIDPPTERVNGAFDVRLMRKRPFFCSSPKAARRVGPRFSPEPGRPSVRPRRPESSLQESNVDVHRRRQLPECGVPAAAASRRRVMSVQRFAQKDRWSAAASSSSMGPITSTVRWPLCSSTLQDRSSVGFSGWLPVICLRVLSERP